ncbi:MULTISPECIES: dihydroxyacetone kinase subunit DhaK [unclassified Microbacterium]|uniref:dihydroxyacetone kinase subunit DhaK n=1 Tax=unclassified Microbacterium TaxID=2609290 RepID=UPI003018EC7B
MSHYFLPEGVDAPLAAARALGSLYPRTLRVSEEPLYLAAANPSPTRVVALVSGGGSGHEPLHGGFVGRGGLDAAVPGQIFASPHNRQIFEASRAVARPGGVLHIVKNYTGDLINFGIAAERLAAEGIRVGRVVVQDDLASGGDGVATGRRGTGSTVIVEKILGAAADSGLDLDALVALGEEIVRRSASVAVARAAHTSPATGRPAFELADDEIEYGIGIHGERAQRSVTYPGARATVEQMVGELLTAVEPHDDVLLLVNGLGGTTNIELAGQYDVVARLLADRGVRLQGAMVGTLVAALDMRGFSISLTSARPEWTEWFRSPTGTPAFPPVETPAQPDPTTDGPARTESSVGAATATEDTATDTLLARMVELSERFRSHLTHLDQQSGDGDFGDNLAGGLSRAQATRTSDESGMSAAARVFLNDVGGTSGPLFGLIFQSVARATDAATASDRAAAFASSLRDGLAAVQRVGSAEPGDRTLVDALAPAAAAGGDLVDAAEAAAAGADRTADLTARRGRASYVGDRALGSPDPGAVGLALVLLAAAHEWEPESAPRVERIVTEWAAR